MPKVLLGVTGSVAATLAPRLVEALLTTNMEVKVVATERAFAFFESREIKTEIFNDGHEWTGDIYKPGSKILHIELRKWADILLIAPLTANTLAKMAYGLADNLLTSVARAWDRQKPLILAPAMNTQMWEHPATAEHLEKLKAWYPKLTIVPPAEKLLACGDVGIGALAPIDQIVEAVKQGVGDVHTDRGA